MAKIIIIMIINEGTSTHLSVTVRTTKTKTESKGQGVNNGKQYSAGQHCIVACSKKEGVAYIENTNKSNCKL